MKSLKEALAEWTDFDIAAHALGVCLGVFPPGSKMNEHKRVFWTSNPLGDKLSDLLRFFVGLEVLEFNEDDLQYRWNPNFKEKEK